MKWNLKICKNKNCWEVLWCFPIKKCKFCWWKDFDYLIVNFKYIDWNINPYYEKSSFCWYIEDYKWINHLFIRVHLWEWNNCDHNWGYIHIVNPLFIKNFI